MAKDADDRFQTAAEVADILNAHLAMINQTPTDKLVALASGKGKWPSPRRMGPSRKDARSWYPLLYAFGTVLALVTVLWMAVREPQGYEKGPGTTPHVQPPGDSAVSDPAPAEITVSQSGESDFNSIVDALAAAGPGTVIRVLDAAAYDGPIVLNDNQRWSGVRLVSEANATLRASSDSSVITINATSGVVVKGFRMQVGLEQRGIEITGTCPGVAIQDIRIQRFDDPAQPASLAVLHLHAGAMGTEDQPITIERVRVRDGNMGVFIGEQGETETEAEPPSGWIHLRECDFVAAHRLTGYHLILASRIENVTISHNLFSTAACGISLWMPQDHLARNVTVQHNTFYDLNSLIVLNGANFTQDDIRFRWNLVHGDAEPVYDGAVADLPPVWFHDNHWTAWPGAASDIVPIARPLTGFNVVSTDPSSSSYLRIAASSDGAMPPTPFPGRYPLPE